MHQLYSTVQCLSQEKLSKTAASMTTFLQSMVTLPLPLVMARVCTSKKILCSIHHFYREAEKQSG